MPLKLRDALRNAEKTQEVKRLKDTGFFLNSAISVLAPNQAVPSSWTLTYYNTPKNEIVQIVVSEGSNEVEVRAGANPLSATQEPLKLEDMKTSAETALKKSEGEFKKFGVPLSQIIISLHEHKWHVNYITKTLQLVIVVLDAKDCSVLSSKIESLTKT